MKAVLLAAGVGDRLGELSAGRPKCLLEFAGRSLLLRHLELLDRPEVEEVVIVGGYRAEMLEAEVARVEAPMPVRVVRNPDFRAGSLVSMLVGLRAIATGTEVLLMDADVLYIPEVLERLLTTAHGNCFLLDREFEAGEEPVKLCLKGRRFVEFRKQLAQDLEFDLIGESVGFFRFSPEVVADLVATAAQAIEEGHAELPYEECIRHLLLTDPTRFGYEDVTGLAWIEIDFPEDVARATSDVLPRLSSQGSSGEGEPPSASR